MTTTTTQDTPVVRTDHRGRLAGTIAAVGGVLYLVAGVRFTADPTAYDTVSAVLSVLWCLGALTGVAGFALLGVAGRTLVGRVALLLAGAGLGLVLLAWLVGFGNPGATEDGTLMTIGRIVTLVGFLGTGVAAIRARRWTGWRRLTPLAYPLAVVLGGLSSAVAGVELTVTLIGLAWVAIGIAVASGAGPGEGGAPRR